MICETTRKGKGESEEEVKPGDLLYGMERFFGGKKTGRNHLAFSRLSLFLGGTKGLENA